MDQLIKLNRIFEKIYFCLLLLCYFYISQFTVKTYCFVDVRCLLKEPRSVIYHCSQYNEDIPGCVCPSVCLSVLLFKCNANENAYSSSVINRRILIRISGERAWHPPLQENEAMHLKNIFKSFKPNFRRIAYLHKKHTPLFTVAWWFSYQRKWFGILYKKMKRYFQTIIVQKFCTEFSKKNSYLLAKHLRLNVLIFSTTSNTKILLIVGNNL